MRRTFIHLPVFCAFLVLLSAAPALAGGYDTPPKAGDPFADVGSFIELDNGVRLQLFVQDNNLVGYFVGPDNLVVESPAESVLFIVNQPGHREDEWRTVLEPVDGVKLHSPRLIYGPYDFRARIIIRFPGKDPASFANVPLNLERNL